jgi:hypothetical protein
MVGIITQGHDQPQAQELPTTCTFVRGVFVRLGNHGTDGTLTLLAGNEIGPLNRLHAD